MGKEETQRRFIALTNPIQLHVHACMERAFSPKMSKNPTKSTTKHRRYCLLKQ